MRRIQEYRRWLAGLDRVSVVEGRREDMHSVGVVSGLGDGDLEGAGARAGAGSLVFENRCRKSGISRSDEEGLAVQTLKYFTEPAPYIYMGPSHRHTITRHAHRM